MNLLSHFACARQLTPLEQAGSALGDLLPLYRRRVRPLPLVAHWSRAAGADAPEREIARGVRFHLHVDSRFHRDALFMEVSGALQAALLNASRAPGLKRFFPAHVLTEMFLDHLLLRDEPDLPASFYALFEGNRPERLADFAAAHPEADRGEFRAFLARFVAERFVDGYEDLGGILWRMQRMLRRFGQRELNPAERRAAQDALSGQAARVHPLLLQFVAAMRHAEWDRAGEGAVPAVPGAPRAEHLAKPMP